MGTIPAEYALDWGWLRIGPPYIYLNIDPIIFNIGPIALRWYGLMYVVAILMGLWFIRRYTARKGIDSDTVYRVLWWCIAAGLIGGRLYFVIQQPDLVEGYLMKPLRIFATWEGGMAFYGAIFLVIPTLIWRARVERINPLVLVDAGVLFGAAGQIFGRFGNIINGDIIGRVNPNVPWATVYQHPNSWACLVPSTCNTPVEPAAAYELLTNIVLLALMLFLARRLKRPGILMLIYLYGYAITQFLIFFTRTNEKVKFFGILDWGLAQAQWTSLVLLVLLVPITFFVLRLRYAQPVPEGEDAARYGISQKPEVKPELEVVTLNGKEGGEPEPIEASSTDEAVEKLAKEKEADEGRNEEEKGDVADKVEGDEEKKGDAVDKTEEDEEATEKSEKETPPASSAEQNSPQEKV